MMASGLLGVGYMHVYLLLCVRVCQVCVPPLLPSALLLCRPLLSHHCLQHFGSLLTPTVIHLSHLVWCPCPFHVFLVVLKFLRLSVYIGLPTEHPAYRLPAANPPNKFKLLFAPCSQTPALVFPLVLVLWGKACCDELVSSAPIKRLWVTQVLFIAGSLPNLIHH